MHDDLEFLYQQLRLQLDAAYAAPKWNPARIALITDDLHRLECQLARRDPDGFLPSGYKAAQARDRTASSQSVM